MNVSTSLLISTAYWPDLAYLSAVLNAETILIEQHEHFVKQTFRNRSSVLTSNGKQLLSIPLVKGSDKEVIKDKRISYAESWQKQHWRTITSAYKNSPYFEFFEDDIKVFYEQRFDLLLDYNTALLKAILHILRKKAAIQFTTEYNENGAMALDLRNDTFQEANQAVYKTAYYQVFEDKFEFIPELSALDALFNVGLETLDICA